MGDVGRDQVADRADRLDRAGQPSSNRVGECSQTVPSDSFTTVIRTGSGSEPEERATVDDPEIGRDRLQGVERRIGGVGQGRLS